MQVHTIGFAGKSAELFFASLSAANVQKLIDVRRSNNTLYCGFTRARDLPYLLKRLSDIAYVHEPNFAPSTELLRQYRVRLKRHKRDPDAWAEFVQRYMAEIAERPILELFAGHTAGLENVCLLCTEPTAECCHRRVLAEYIAGHSDQPMTIQHL